MSSPLTYEPVPLTPRSNNGATLALLLSFVAGPTTCIIALAQVFFGFQFFFPFNSPVKMSLFILIAVSPEIFTAILAIQSLRHISRSHGAEKGAYRALTALVVSIIIAPLALVAFFLLIDRAAREMGL